jgi:hypothetical protein
MTALDVSAGRQFGTKKENFLKFILSIAILCNILDSIGLDMTIREAIQKELQRRTWTYYRLAKELEGKMPQRTIYAYLSGECDLVSDRVSIILDVLGLTVTSLLNKRKKAKK